MNDVMLSNGDKVQLNVEVISNRFDFEKAPSKYKEWVLNSYDKVFVVKRAKPRQGDFVKLVGDNPFPDMLFWFGDLKGMDD